MKSSGTYEITDIGNKTYLINEKLSTMFVLKGETSALVIDCGTGIGDFKGVIEELVGDLPYKVVATHSHVDHIGGRGQFNEIYLSEADSKYIKTVNMAYRRFYAFTNMLMGNNVKNKAFTSVKKEPEVHLIKENDVFDLGSRIIRVYETPGHTVGSISLLDETNRIIFIGDVANEFLFMWLPHCTSIDTMTATIKKIIGIKDYDVVWASHHTQPFKRKKLNEFLNGSEMLAKKKNSLLPIIHCYKYGNNKIFYKANNIHK